MPWSSVPGTGGGSGGRYAREVAGVDAYVAAGLYDPDDPGHGSRVALLDWLTGEIGFTLDDIRRWTMGDAISGVAGDRRMVPGERHDRETAIARTGLAPDEFDAVTTAFGFQPIHGAPPGEVGYTDDELEMLRLVADLGVMFTPAEVLTLIRVIGGSLARIAEAAVSLFLVDVEAPHLQMSNDEFELAQKVYAASGLIDGFTARLDPILRRQIQQAVERNRRSSINSIERLQYRLAVGFVDLVGFTALSGRLPAGELSAFLARFEASAHDVVARHGARVTKLIGDEVMFVATTADEAAAAALGLVAAFSTGFDGVQPRGGLAFGHVLLRGGDYYGSVVNLASRLVDLAVPNEVLVTEAVATAAPRCRFEPAGRRVVKGFDEPIAVRSLVDVEASPDAR